MASPVPPASGIGRIAVSEEKVTHGGTAAVTRGIKRAIRFGTSVMVERSEIPQQGMFADLFEVILKDIADPELGMPKKKITGIDGTIREK